MIHHGPLKVIVIPLQSFTYCVEYAETNKNTSDEDINSLLNKYMLFLLCMKFVENNKWGM